MTALPEITIREEDTDMDFTNKEIFRKIIDELSEIGSRLGEDEILALEEEIRQADRIFVAGAGRALMMIRGLAMRLMHFGYTTYVVGETCTPAIREGDLLIIASGSGSTGSLTVMAQRAKGFGARLALITTNPDSPIGKQADRIVHVKTSTCKLEAASGEEAAYASFQPGANAFEQCLHLICDTISIKLCGGGDVSGENEELMSRHANLE